mmetsp:Transcript_9365/g.31099  ORF Transcript_9365/g.31099 Transcript_9365/m.31099 type:complete len:317 (+) Transcript_9365:1348-2298(+)
MMSTADRTLGIRDVNGAAMEASPSLTCDVSMSSAPSISCIICANPGVCMAPPRARWRSAALRLVSVTIRVVAAFIAPNCAHLSPAASRAAASSSNHFFCNTSNSAWSRLRALDSVALSSFIFRCASCTRFIFSAKVSAFVVTTVPSGLVVVTGVVDPPLSAVPGTGLVFAPPNPLSNATPTCACFSAPTSFAPSPHINVCRPCCFSLFRTLSLSSGDIRAKITTESRKSHKPPSRSSASAAFRVSPVTHSEYCLDKLTIDFPSHTYGISNIGASVPRSVFALTHFSFGLTGELVVSADLVSAAVVSDWSARPTVPS